MTFELAHVGGGTFAPLQLLPATISGVLYALRAHHLENTPRAVWLLTAPRLTPITSATSASDRSP